MRHILTLLLLIAATALSAKDYHYTTATGDLSATRIYTLDNGLTVYLSRNTAKPRIAAYIAVRTGSRNDPAETTGLAHYLEHIMFKGTTHFGTSDAAKERVFLDSIRARYEVYRKLADKEARRQCYHKIDSLSQLAAQWNIPNEYDKLMSAIGAEGTNAWTSNDQTVYTEDIPANEIEAWAKIQSDRFQNMVIRGFHTELEAVYEEYNIGQTNDSWKLDEALCALLFPGHPYGTQTTIGKQAHLKNPSIVNIENYFRKYYVPNNVAICMAGDLDPDSTIAILDRHFGQWKPGRDIARPEYAYIPEATAPRDTTVWGPESERMYIGWRFEKASSLQTDTLTMAAKILFNGTAGLLDLDINQPVRCMMSAAMVEPQDEYNKFVLVALPNEGQPMEEVRTMLLAEIDKLKAGDFDESLMKAVVANERADYYKSLEDNENRVYNQMYAFTQHTPWQQYTGRIDRMAKLTRQDIIDFANRHFRGNDATVYKRTGADTTQAKIDKPAITAIPANRDKQSQFVSEIIAAKPKPIEPQFVDYKRDIEQAQTKHKLPVMYVKNTTNGLFNLVYRYNFGTTSDKWLEYAAGYLDFVGTDKMTNEQIKKRMYELACQMNINAQAEDLYVNITGLAENMPQAMELMEQWMHHAKADTAAWAAYAGMVLTSRAIDKLDQKENAGRLFTYGQLGKHNRYLNRPDSAELANADPAHLLALVDNLKNYPHEVLYYGPDNLRNVVAAIDKRHTAAKKPVAAPQNKPYERQTVAHNEVWIAPYDAKNIYMEQVIADGTTLDLATKPECELFNEYFGGGMNTIVFQELRESRGLAYSASSYYSKPADKGRKELAYTYIISQNDKLADCIRTFNHIIDTIPQSPAAFDIAKQAVAKRLAAKRTRGIDIIYSYIAARRMGIDYDIDSKIFARLPELTIADIVRFEQQRMARKPMRYLILGDEKELDMDFLRTIGPIRKLTTEEIFGY